jgi:uncharacterized protein
MKKLERAIRDPVHDYISLSKAENDIIDSPFVQRLRWVSQLSGVRLVFPGGTHNRLSHVMGVMHLAGRYAEGVFMNDTEVEYKTQLARIAGLLHDVAHGAFSHAYDDTVYRKLYQGNSHGHDTHRLKMIKSEFLAPLIENCNITVKEIESIWEGKDPVIQAIVQGAIGADRMDFMLRDSYYTGTSHFGTVAASRIIDNALIAEHNGKLALHYSVKVLDDIFQALLGRFYMYRGVYFHKASSAADILVRKLLQHSTEPLELVNRTENLELFQYVNEYTLIGEIMSSKDQSLDRAKYYTQRFLKRELPKLVWEHIVLEDTVKSISTDLERGSEIIAIEQFVRKINERAKKLGKKEPHIYITNTYPMSTLDHKEFTAGNVFIYDSKGILKRGQKSLTLAESISSTSYFKPFLSGMDTRQRYIIIRVYCDPIDAVWIKKEVEFTKSDFINIDETSY